MSKQGFESSKTQKFLVKCKRQYENKVKTRSFEDFTNGFNSNNKSTKNNRIA